MKLLYCVLTIFVAANAEPVPPTRESLENVVSFILQQIEHAPESIDKFIDESKQIVTDKILKNERLNKAMSSVNDKLVKIIEKGQEVDQESKRILACTASIMEALKKLIIDMNNDLLHKVLVEKFGKSSDFLSKLKKDIADIRNLLENHADEEIKACLAGKSKCKLTEEFLTRSEDYFSFEDVIKPALISTVKSSDEYFNSLEIGNKIVTNINHPTHECLNPNEKS